MQISRISTVFHVLYYNTIHILIILDKALDSFFVNDIDRNSMDQKHIKTKIRFDKSFSLTPMGLLLAACGGSGGGTATSSSTTNTTSTPTTFSYSGAASAKSSF